MPRLLRGSVSVLSTSIKPPSPNKGRRFTSISIERFAMCFDSSISGEGNGAVRIDDSQNGWTSRTVS